MVIVTVLAALYLMAGIYYAIFLQRTGLYSWIFIPLNILVGPVLAAYLFVVTIFYKKKRMYIRLHQ